MTQQAGEYIEERLLGMLLASPSRLSEATHLLESDFVCRYNWLILEAMRTVGTDIHDIVAEFPKAAWVGEYLADLAVNESFSPENISAYVRVLKDLSGQRAYRESVGKLASKSGETMFGGV